LSEYLVDELVAFERAAIYFLKTTTSLKYLGPAPSCEKN